MVVPCHKSADEIGHTLRSLLQYFEPQHIVVCDNGNNLTPMAQDECATQKVVAAVSNEYLESLPANLRRSKGPIRYFFIPEGHKTQALCTGALRLNSLRTRDERGAAVHAVDAVPTVEPAPLKHPRWRAAC